MKNLPVGLVNQDRRRQDHNDRGRRLPRTRPGHPAPPRTLQAQLPAWKEEHNTTHRKVRARVEHTFARMKTWKSLRDCRLKGDGVYHAMRGIACLHNLTVARWRRSRQFNEHVVDHSRDNA